MHIMWQQCITNPHLSWGNIWNLLQLSIFPLLLHFFLHCIALWKWGTGWWGWGGVGGVCGECRPAMKLCWSNTNKIVLWRRGVGQVECGVGWCGVGWCGVSVGNADLIWSCADQMSTKLFCGSEGWGSGVWWGSGVSRGCRPDVTLCWPKANKTA